MRRAGEISIPSSSSTSSLESCRASSTVIPLSRSVISEAEQQTSYRDLKVDEVKKLIEGGEYEVVDVREGWERERGHIPGSRHVVLSRILANPGGQQFKEHTIFACEVGERSSVASEMAVALGVKDVVNFRGGHKAWREAGLPLEKGL